MSAGFVITGTDTDIGKTVFSAALVQALNGFYFKPIQAGLNEPTDSQRVKLLTGMSQNRILPEVYRLKTAASPHYSAQLDGVEIDVNLINLPQVKGPLIIEGAGGLMVPLTKKALLIDLFCLWKQPVILCAPTRLGTINHSLLSINALKQRDISIHGIVFIGNEVINSQTIIQEYSGVNALGRLPIINDLNPKSLKQAFADHFDLADFFSINPK